VAGTLGGGGVTGTAGGGGLAGTTGGSGGGAWTAAMERAATSSSARRNSWSCLGGAIFTALLLCIYTIKLDVPLCVLGRFPWAGIYSPTA
jgi:hypothetical protein